MARTILSRIIDNMDTVFRGDAWHGPSVMEIINSLPNDKLYEKHPFSKRSIIENVYHILSYKRYTIEKLNDNIHYRVETHEQNWGTEEELANPAQIKKDLIAAHNQIISELEKYDDRLLDKNVPGEYYNFYKLLNGLIQHDTYQLGKIWVLWQ